MRRLPRAAPERILETPQVRAILDRTATVRLAPSLDPLSTAEREAVIICSRRA